MALEKLSDIVELAENVDMFSCKFITDYLDRNNIPYDMDGLILRDKNLKRWISFPELVENPQLIETFEYDTHKECSIRIHFPNKPKHISICKIGNAWMFDFIEIGEHHPVILEADGVLTKLAYHLVDYLLPNS